MNRSSGLKSPENLVLEPAGRTGSLTWLRFETRLGFFTKGKFYLHYNTTGGPSDSVTRCFTGTFDCKSVYGDSFWASYELPRVQFILFAIYISSNS